MSAIPAATMSTRTAALRAIAEGSFPVPIPRGSKNPGIKGWQDLRLTAADGFAEDGNIGTILGIPPRFDHDVDLDCEEARRLADDFLPATGREHGRPSAPRSHRWYRADEPGKLTKFTDPEDKSTLCELRGRGGQTCVPPSVHPEGEQLAYEKDGEPAAVPLAELRVAVSRLAAACLIARRYPKANRHAFTLALAGLLLRRGMQAPDVEALILAVARSIPGAHDADDVAHIKANVRDTAEKLSSGVRVTGGTTLSEWLTPKTMDKLTEWLGLSGEAAEVRAIVVSSDSWRDALDRRFVTGRGFIYVPNYRNAAIYLEHDERYTGRIRFNEFSRRIMLDENPWRDADDLNVLEWLQEPTREIPAITKTAAQDAAKWVAEKHTYHPVRDYLAGLTHDGTPRIDSWLIDHAGAVDTPYVRAVSAAWLISAVARVMRPGCQVDTALILESPQGIRKSSAVEVLGAPWFSTLSAATLHGKEAPEQLAGKWLVEMSELSGMRRSEVSAIKDFISRRNDYFRAPYAHVADDHLRQCVLAGTTNDAAYLHDDTGARRFWPVRVRAFDVAALAAVRDQLWAEAVARYQAGEPWHLSPELEAVAAEEQEDRRVSDPWEDSVGVILERAVRDAPYMTCPSVSAAEVLYGLGLPVERFTTGGLMRVAAVLARHGWKMHRPRGKNGTQSKRYFLEDSSDSGRLTESSMVSGPGSTESTESVLIVKKTVENPITTTAPIQSLGSRGVQGTQPDSGEKAPPIGPSIFPEHTSRNLAAEYEIYRAAQEAGR